MPRFGTLGQLFKIPTLCPVNFWDAKLMEKMEENRINRDLEYRYKGEIRVILIGLKKGWEWLEDGLYCHMEGEIEDERSYE